MNSVTQLMKSQAKLKASIDIIIEKLCTMQPKNGPSISHEKPKGIVLPIDTMEEMDRCELKIKSSPEFKIELVSNFEENMIII